MNNTLENGNKTLYSVSDENQIIGTAFYISTIVFQIDITLSMGAIVTVQDILDQFKRPLCIFIAFVSQFVAMPLSAFGLFPSTIALGATILATCPGGSASNLFTYCCNGDVPLSIMLTSMSTVLATAFMPLNLWLYTRQLEGGYQLKVPYKSIAITLAWILVPFFLGMLAKRFTKKLANLLNKIGSPLGILLLWVCNILQYIMYTEAFHKGWKLWLIAAAIPTVGCFLGYFLAFIATQPSKLCKTIAIETGMQSISLASTVVVTSFPAYMHGKMTPFIIMAGTYVTVFFLILAAILRIVATYNKRRSAKTVSSVS